jgi:hypothetical protein
MAVKPMATPLMMGGIIFLSMFILRDQLGLASLDGADGRVYLIVGFVLIICSFLEQAQPR